MVTAGFGNTEILQIVDAVAREKGIERDSVLEAMESAIEIAGRRKYGHDHDVRAEIDRKTGEIRLFREMEVVENVEDYITQISLGDAKEKNAEAVLGDKISEPLPPIDLGRVAAQTAKQVIVQRVRDAERDKQFEDYKDRVGEIANGTVKRIEYGNIILDFGSTEAILLRDAQIRGEQLRQGDRIRAYIEDVRREAKGPQIFLSRSHPQFMVKLFAQEVPEVYDKVIEVKAVARDPGSRAKIAVLSNDSNIDPVGSCVGVRGARVQNVINELQGEKIDIIEWSADPASFVVNALAPAEVSKVVIDEDRKRIEVVLPDNQLSLAIGRRGQNVRLASQIVGWNIDVLSEDDESKRRVEEFHSLTKLFIASLDVEEVIAQLLASEGFASIEEVAYVPIEEMASIEGFDEDIANELRTRARDYLENESTKLVDKWKELGITEELADKSSISAEELIVLAENDVKTWSDLGDLSREEFREILPKSALTNDEIDTLIMNARSEWLDSESDDKEAVAETTEDKESA